MRAISDNSGIVSQVKATRRTDLWVLYVVKHGDCKRMKEHNEAATRAGEYMQLVKASEAKEWQFVVAASSNDG